MLELETLTEAQAKTLARVEEELMSGRTFRLVAASTRSIIGYQPPTSHRKYADALAMLAKGAGLGDRQASLIARIVPALTLHLQAGDMVARMYDAAAEALSGDYFDTIRAASPEPGRHSDNVHAYTLADRITLAYTLSWAGGCILPGHGGAGWCLELLRKREGVYVLPEPGR